MSTRRTLRDDGGSVAVWAAMTLVSVAVGILVMAVVGRGLLSLFGTSLSLPTLPSG